MLFILFASYAQELVEKAITDSLIEVTLKFMHNIHLALNISRENFLKSVSTDG